jgi:membrane fusion protein (multidrug efflux system)
MPAFCALTIAGIMVCCSSSSEEGKDGQPGKQMLPLVSTVPAIKAAVSLKLELTGSVEPYRIARLASPAEGPVVNVRVREGDWVKAGQSLLSIGRKKGVDALIVSLREELKKEADNLDRTRKLVEAEALPREHLDQAGALYEKVNAQLIKAEETARDYGVIAPWTGVVSRVIVKEGEFIAPRAPVLEMYDPSGLVIRAAVSEKYSAVVAVGMAALVQMDAYPNDALKGKIERVYPYLDSRLRVRTIEIGLTDSVNLLPGMFARLTIILKTERDAVVVPTEAVVIGPKGRTVFVLDNGKAIARPILTGVEEGNRIQITSGIHDGDQVIVAGNEKLKDGAAVRGAGEGMGNTAPGHSAARKKKTEGAK